MRTLYTLALIIGTPFIFLHFAIRGLKDRSYLAGWGQRLGFYPADAQSGGVVVHAASVGEVNAAAPLITALLDGLPGLSITVTTFTPTGSRRLRRLFGDRVGHFFAPLDIPWAVGRLFSRTSPSLLIIMETEIWPNLFHAARKNQVPLLIANARLSEKSINSYARIRGLIREALGGVSFVAAQSQTDAQRYIDCGARPEKVTVTGNLKFDISVNQGLAERAQSLREHWGKQRPVVIAASTHEADDQVVLDAFGQVLEHQPDCLLILVPRHPERFVRAGKLASNAGFRTEAFSDGPACSPDAQCFVIDAMGELPTYFACSDIAFIGGSFGDIGGHNSLEASAQSIPVILGPNTGNFRDINHALIEGGAAAAVHDEQQLAGRIIELLEQPEKRRAMGQAGFRMVENGKGALKHTLVEINKLLEQRKPD